MEYNNHNNKVGHNQEHKINNNVGQNHNRVPDENRIILAHQVHNPEHGQKHNQDPDPGPDPDPDPWMRDDRDEYPFCPFYRFCVYDVRHLAIVRLLAFAAVRILSFYFYILHKEINYFKMCN